jgi:ribonuclease P/MRP protein subunit RPP1
MLNETFFDMGVHAYPEGGSYASVLALTAKNYGYAGICVADHQDFFPEAKAETPEGIEVVHGVEIVAGNQNELRKYMDRYRKQVRVVTVHGGDEVINRAACEDERVDILAHPADGKTSGINHILAKLAADKHVAIAFEMAPIICGKGGSRVRVLSNYRTNLALVKKYGTPYVIISGAMSHYDMRDVRTTIALCSLFGMGEKDAIKGLSFYPSEILRRHSPGYVMEGVEILGL